MATEAIKKRTAKAAQHTGRYILVGATVRKVPEGVLVWRRFGDLPTSVRDKSKKRVFISYTQRATDDLLEASLKLGRGVRMGDLLTLEPPRLQSVPALTGLFERVIGAIAGYRWLPSKELPTVLSGKEAAARFIGGAVDPASHTVALVRGNLATLVVPFTYFKSSGDGTSPDFSRLSFTDYGLTIGLGAYEASADGILYEHDPAYRQSVNKALRATERSFGASLRRLRLQRQVMRSDFPGMSSKTIARIERGEVGRPHGKTLLAIAKRLDVSIDQIETY
jgi:Helix-turn-helix